MSSSVIPPSVSGVDPVFPFAAGTRVAGAVIALGYLLGFVPGPIVSVVGGLALMTYGRHLLTDRAAASVSGMALAVIGGALGIASLRWGALDLGDLRGVQSVLGPTLLVGPTPAAAATSVAAGAAVVGLAVWLARPWPNGRPEKAWAVAEGAIGALAIVTVFFVPAPSALEGGGFASALGGIARWVGVVLVVTAAAVAGARVLHGLRETWRAVVLAAAGLAVVVAAAVLVSAV